jgi:hypothetical protein
MNESPTSSERPASHQRLIALMQAANPPPAQPDAPPLPDELLRRLQERYASATASAPSRAPTLWNRVRGQINRSNLVALAACLLLIGLVAKVSVPEKEDAFGTMRGISDAEKTVPAYWLSDNNTMPAPAGPLMPKLTSIGRPEDLPKTGTVMVFDSAKKEARLVQDGQITATTNVFDAAESEDWISARRQLLNSLKP